MTRRLALLAGAFLAAGAPAGITAFQSGSSWRARDCTAMTTAAAPDGMTLRISSVSMNAAAALQPGGPGTPGQPPLPEHCEVVGRLNERVGVNGQKYAIAFRLRLPTTWNGRFFFQGGGGSNGTVGNAAGVLQGNQPAVALGLGYAVVSQDAGHDNATNNDPARGGTLTFGLDPQARRDLGYNSYDVGTRLSKALITQYYSRAPEKSYFVGCSEGGREGMMLTQRFPNHFDGVLACSPGFRLPRAAVAEAWDSQAFAVVARASNLVDQNNQPLLNKAFTDDDLVLVANAVLAACDNLDGVVDAMIQNFEGCSSAVVEPRLTALTCAGAKTDACLTTEQIAALRKVFGGARTSTGSPIYAPWAWDAGISSKVGAAYNQGWRSWKLGGYNEPGNTAINLTLGARALPHLFVTPPVPTPATGGAPAAYSLAFRMDDAPQALSNTTDTYQESSLEFMKADSTDLSAFKARGGKLVLVHGVSDPVFSILDTIAWWKDLDRINAGRASDVVRLFAVPGMNHCTGGPSTDQFDAFGALVNWVEKGTAPERIVAMARTPTPWPGRTRPLCAYPRQARYNGSGSIEDAANFTCQ